MRVMIHLDHGRSPASWTRLFQAGEVFDPSPYGYDSAAEYCDLVFSVDARESKAVRFLRRGMSYVLGFDLVHAMRNRRALSDCDIIWTHTEHEHLAIALLQRLRLARRRPIIGQTIWLWDSWSAMGPIRRLAIRWLLAAVTLHTTHSPLNAAIARAVVGNRVLVVPFGIEQSIASMAAAESETATDGVDALAPGNDRHRDWKTLADAVAISPGIRCIVLSRRKAAQRVQRPDGRLLVRQSDSVAEAVRLFVTASAVVVPLRPNHHASGFTVALEALSLGRPIVLTRTGGLDAYFEGIAHWSESGDARSLSTAIDQALSSDDSPTARAARRGWVVEHGLTTRDYALRHVLISRALLHGRAIPEAVAALRRVDVN